MVSSSIGMKKIRVHARPIVLRERQKSAKDNPNTEIKIKKSDSIGSFDGNFVDKSKEKLEYLF